MHLRYFFPKTTGVQHLLYKVLLSKLMPFLEQRFFSPSMLQNIAQTLLLKPCVFISV